MSWFDFIVRKKTSTPEGQKLAEIRELLFPRMELRETKDGDKYYVNSDLDVNLDSALMDLRSGYNDEVVQNTIDGAVEKLSKIRQILEAYDQDYTEASTIFIGMPGEKDID